MPCTYSSRYTRYFLPVPGTRVLTRSLPLLLRLLWYSSLQSNTRLNSCSRRTDVWSREGITDETAVSARLISLKGMPPMYDNDRLRLPPLTTRSCPAIDNLLHSYYTSIQNENYDAEVYFSEHLRAAAVRPSRYQV